MARDNDKGLYLPLRINLDEWERSLAGADKELKDAMRKMSTEIKDLKFRYSVEIEGAKASGNYLKAIQLRTAQTNQLLEVQTRIVNGLSNAYAKLGDKSTEQARNLEKQLNQQRKILYQLQQEQGKLGAGIGTKISDALASASPTFASVRDQIKTVTNTMGELSASSGATAASIKLVGGAIGTVAAGLAAIQGMNALDKHVNEVAKGAATASESVFALRENFNLTTEQAEKLAGVASIDGVSVDALATAMRKLNKQLETAGEDGNLASDTLAKYGVSLRNADGSMKSMTAQVKAIADGYQRAKEAGDDLNYVTNTLGAGGSQFTHLLNGYDDYVAAWEKIGKLYDINYDKLHLLYQKDNELKEAERQLAVARGAGYNDAAIEKMDAEIRKRKEQVAWLQEHAGLYERIGDGAMQWGRITEALSKKWDDFYNSVISGWMAIFATVGGTAAGKIADLLGLPQAKKDAVDLKAELAKVMRQPAQTTTTTKEDKQAAKKAEEEAKKAAEAQKKFQDALFNATASDYDKAIKRIADERDAFIAAKVSEVDAERLFAIQKEQIDKQYYDKRRQEEEKIAKQVQDSYKQQVAAAKQAREAAMSEAEQTLRNNVKLVRYMDKMRQQGGNYEQAGREYAERLYLKNAGFNRNDIGLLREFGVSMIKDIANVRDRLFSDFAPAQAVNNTTNNTTVNIDRPILTDENLINQLTSQILDRIAPVFQQPVSGNSLS